MRAGASEADVGRRGPPPAFVLVGMALLMTLLHTACEGTSHTVPSTTLRLAMGSGTVPPRQLGEALVQAHSPTLSGIALELLPGFGAVDNAFAVQNGTADIAFTLADVAYFATIGQLEGRPAADRLRGIANFQLTPVHLVVRSDAVIHTVDDLRGHRVSIGGAGSGTSVTAKIVMEAFGIDFDTLKIESIGDNPARIKAGTLDAYFIVGNTSVVRQLTRDHARVLAIAGPSIDRIQREYPFMRPMVIPAGMAADEAVRTVGVDSLLVCRSELDEELIYRFTKALFEALPSFPSDLEVLQFMDAEQAPATPIPLHIGAARYYREREMAR
jgi:uncharacterized protein